MSTSFTHGENPLRADKLNQAFSERVSRSGDTMSGLLTLAQDPVKPFDAATKQYVDRFTGMGVPTGAYIGPSPPGNTLAPLWWDNVSGQLFIQYNDGNSTQWVSASTTSLAGMAGLYLPLTGGTVTGATTFTAPVTLSGGGAMSGTWTGNPTFGNSPSVTNNLTVGGIFTLGSNTATQRFLNINAAANVNKSIQFQSGGLNRWILRSDQSSGDDFLLQACRDSDGASLGDLLRFDRAYGAQKFSPYPVVFSGADGGTPAGPGATIGSMTYSMNSSYSGATTNSAGITFNRWWVTGDTTTDVEQGVYYAFQADYGPATTGGGRTNLQSFIRTIGDLTSSTAATVTGFRSHSQVLHAGGAGGSFIGGAVQSCDFNAELVNAATGWGGVQGIQNNLSVSGVGANNLQYRSGLFFSVGMDGGTQAGRRDAMISCAVGPVNNPPSWPAPGMAWKHALALGNGGTTIFPIDPYNGEIIGTLPAIQTPGNATVMPPQAALHGINLSKINFGESAFWSPGFKVAGAGTTRITRMQVSAGTNGPAIDAPLQVAAITSIASSTSGVGTSFAVGEQIHDNLGGVALVDTVVAGAATAAHYIYPPYVAAGDVITVASAIVATQAAIGATVIHLKSGSYCMAAGDTVVTAGSVAGIPGSTTANSVAFSNTDPTVTLSAALTAILPAGTMLLFKQTMPSATATFRTGSEGICVANISWTAATEVSIGSTNVDVRIGKGSAGATTDTKGHLLIPFVAGTPTGVPTNAAEGTAMRYDTSGHKIWFYDTGTNTWRGVAVI